ncbi:TVP38/TMEM64 family protein [Peterkaempfera bronchialis]|uniref:TVP38/TMEM64 family membrane protein n=1 Tax=Peterkaempfera bronchialis TaxID=2126346 RepID=A0A345SRV1_9ACTN|nr:TVP38/TMEM64 family protein [Peterkaempfera bronchialis]AXI76456.1 TVP38/TMEM64 family protein [Peterkaempfera bronchialis]
MPEEPPPRAARALLPPRARLALLVLLLSAAACSLLLWSPQRLLSPGFTGLVPAPWAGPAFAVLFALSTLAFVPKPVLNAAAGALFGIHQGLALAVAGTTLGAALAFALGRGLGRDALRPLLRTKVLAALDRRLTHQGFRSVLLLRIIPGVPFAAANYGAAFSGVRPLVFLTATAVGVVPGTAAYVVAGASAASPTSPAFLLSAGLIVATGLFSTVSLWRARRRSTPRPAEPVPSRPGSRGARGQRSSA